MARKTHIPLHLAALFIIAMSACNYPLSTESEASEELVEELDDVSLLATTVAQTLSAVQSQLEGHQNTQEPTATTLPTPTPSDEDDNGVTTSVQNYTYSTTSCYAASSVSETIADYTVLEPGEDFTKTWTLLNSGSCSWYSGYLLVYTSGYQMDGDSPQYISSEISPGESVTFSIDMEAPDSEGTYTGNWELQTSDGSVIAYLWVKIIVENDDDFSVTGVTFSNDETYTGVCPYTYTYKAYITTSEEGDVIYSFKYSDGSTGSATTLEFDENETQTVSGSWILNASGDYWVRVYIQSPNNQTFSQAELSLRCITPTNTPTTVPAATEDPEEENGAETDGDDGS